MYTIFSGDHEFLPQKQTSLLLLPHVNLHITRKYGILVPRSSPCFLYYFYRQYFTCHSTISLAPIFSSDDQDDDCKEKEVERERTGRKKIRKEKDHSENSQNYFAREKIPRILFWVERDVQQLITVQAE